MTTLEHYKSMRQHPQSRASYCLRSAKHYALVDSLWDDAVENGLVRARIEPDNDLCYDDLAGDCYDVELNKDSVSGGERTIKAQEKQFKSLIERDGVWGFITETREFCDKCGNGDWEHADSCWGFVGEIDEAYMYDGKYAALKQADLIS